MPLGEVVTRVNASDSCQTEAVWQTLAARPPAAEVSISEVEGRSLPRVQADGAHSNSPTSERAQQGAYGCKRPDEAMPGQKWTRFTLQWRAAPTSSRRLVVCSRSLTVRPKVGDLLFDRTPWSHHVLLTTQALLSSIYLRPPGEIRLQSNQLAVVMRFDGGLSDPPVECPPLYSHAPMS